MYKHKRFIIAPSATGKTTYIKNREGFSDADEIPIINAIYCAMTDRYGDKWYLDDTKGERIHEKNEMMRTAIFSDDRIIVSAEPSLVHRFDQAVVVLIPPAEMVRNSLQRNSTIQPVWDLESAKREVAFFTQTAKKQGWPIVNDFDLAVSILNQNNTKSDSVK